MKGKKRRKRGTREAPISTMKVVQNTALPFIALSLSIIIFSDLFQLSCRPCLIVFVRPDCAARLILRWFLSSSVSFLYVQSISLWLKYLVHSSPSCLCLSNDFPIPNSPYDMAAVYPRLKNNAVGKCQPVLVYPAILTQRYT